jgi:hypothetical protein
VLLSNQCLHFIKVQTAVIARAHEQKRNALGVILEVEQVFLERRGIRVNDQVVAVESLPICSAVTSSSCLILTASGE